MADFIAVIRRAVDGLAENTPEMRAKVYERARGAVQRQLENMKPRPPEAMLQRQLEKLETAIREVEGEHSEALPGEEADIASAVSDEATEPAPVAEAAGPEPAPEAAEHEPQEAAVGEADEATATEEVAAGEAAPAAEVAAEEQWHPPHEEEAPAEEWRAAESHEPAAAEHAVEEEPVLEDRSADREEVAAAPAADDAGPVSEEPFAPAGEEPREAEPEGAGEEAEPFQPIARGIDHASNRLVEPVAAFEQPPEEFVEHSRDEPLQAAADAHFDPVWSEPAAETPAPAPKDAETGWAEEELRQFSETTPEVVSPEASARAFDEAISSIESAPQGAVMPAAKESFSWEAAAFDDLPSLGTSEGVKAASVHFDDADIFAEVHGGKPAAGGAAAGDVWREAKPLRGYDRRSGVADDGGDADTPMDLDQVVASKLQGRSFRMEPKRRRFGIGTIITLLIALAAIGGGAYAGWMNREALVAMVDGLVSSAVPQAARNEPPAEPAAPQPDSNAAKPQTATEDAKPAQPDQQAASLNDGSSAGSKFTQRLLADGTEVDNGPAAVPGAQAAEGKSVAEQNVASADVTPNVRSDAAPAQPVAPNGPAAAQQNAPVGSVEKMFLYEERIGQSSPTAIEGSVVWSLQHEAGPDGRQEATVQGNITVPERNLSALVTFKRNSDPSLPASHLVEIVFSVPPNFEGGSIDSVQRISMKRTEQDRGDALIAVPAKITDDFHMVALNDYPDARKANLDLLSTRDWIDIPITYRNGRRALLTMDKGSTGKQAFDTAIKEWAALGDVSTSQ